MARIGNTRARTSTGSARCAQSPPFGRSEPADHHTSSGLPHRGLVAARRWSAAAGDAGAGRGFQLGDVRTANGKMEGIGCVPEQVPSFGKACTCHVRFSAVEIAHVPQCELGAICGTHAVSHQTQAESVSGKGREEIGVSQARLEDRLTDTWTGLAAAQDGICKCTADVPARTAAKGLRNCLACRLQFMHVCS